MTPGEFRKFASTMKEFGISKARFGDVEITMGSNLGSISDNHSYRESTDSPLHSKASADPVVEKRADEIQSVLKLSDEDLVDQLFPENPQSLEPESA